MEVVKFASTSGLNPEIASVFFKKDKTVATDTFRLVEISVNSTVNVKDFPKLPDGKTAMAGFKPFIVPREAAAEISKMKIGKNDSLPILSYVAVSKVQKESVEFIATNLETGDTKTIRTIDGKFPDYEKLFDAGNPIAEFEVNGKYMASICETLAKFNKLNSVKIKFYGKEKAILLEAKNENQAGRAALMPIKDL